MTKVVSENIQVAVSQQKQCVPAIERAVVILDFIAATVGTPGVSELARALGLPKSTVHGICYTLCELGLLRKSGSGFDIGSGSLRWSTVFLGRSSLVSEFESILAQDQRLDDYTVMLSSLTGGDVMYLACRNAAKPLGFTFQLGMRLPAIYTATGKAMLAFMNNSQRQSLIESHWAEPFTSNSVSDGQALELQCKEWRQLGYALDRGEIRDGMVCLGAPVLNQYGQPVAGIAISMTSAEARPEVLNEFGNIVKSLALKFTVR